jgi:hypothetical protein
MELMRILQNNKIYFLIIFVFICIYYFFYFPKTNNFKQKLNIIDLSQQLDPTDVYESIQCRISAEFVIKTLLCVHNRTNDYIISGEILSNGFFEGYVLGPFMNFIYNNPDWLVIDVGANIGNYYRLNNFKKLY